MVRFIYPERICKIEKTEILSETVEKGSAFERFLH